MQGGSKIKFYKVHDKDPVILRHSVESHAVTFRRSGESGVLVRFRLCRLQPHFRLQPVDAVRKWQARHTHVITTAS